MTVLSDLPFSGALASYSGSVQVIPNNQQTFITFDKAYYDTDGYFTLAQNDRLTPPIAGIYELGATVGWASNSSGSRQVRLLTVAGTRILCPQYESPGNSQTGCVQRPSTPAFLQAGEAIRLQVFQSSGGNLNAVGEAGFGAGFEAPLSLSIRLLGVMAQGYRR